MTPAPAGLELDDAADDFAAWPDEWVCCSATFVLPHGEEAAALAARYAEVVAGDTVVHSDVRDDNLLLADDGRVLLCDWNWPVRGRRLARLARCCWSGRAATGSTWRRCWRPTRPSPTVDPEAVDIVLALLAGYFLGPRRRPGAVLVALPARPPALAGRGVLGVAVRAAWVGVEVGEAEVAR